MIGRMDFGGALEELRAGQRVAREGWNGPGQYIVLVNPPAPPYTFTWAARDAQMTLPFLAIRTVQDDLVPWLASQTDLLAEDWITVLPKEEVA